MGSCVSSKSGEVYASQEDSLKNNIQSPSSQEVGGKKKRGPIYLGGSSKSNSKMSKLASAVISPSAKHTATVSEQIVEHFLTFLCHLKFISNYV